MSTRTQKSSRIAIGTSLGEDVLLIRSLTATEELGRLFSYEVELISERPEEVKYDSLLGSNATVRMQLPKGGTRYFNGFFSRFTFTAVREGIHHYRAVLVPWLWFLTRTADCRIFQKKTIPEIITQVFHDHGFSDFELKLTASYRNRDFCVQYRETDFNFVSRLMEQEGIYYFFEHENGKHRLVLADSLSAHSPFADYDVLEFRPEKSQLQTHEFVFDWSLEREVQPGAYALNDFNFEMPKSSLLARNQIERPHQLASFEVYDYPGEYEKVPEGTQYSKIRIQEMHARFEIGRGQANVRGIHAGSLATLEDFPESSHNKEYLITGTTIHITGDEFDTAPNDGEDFFTCSFTAIPTQQVFRPLRTTPKPLIQGPQTAIVAGPSGEEIFTDKYGRVKLQFHWDRYGKADEEASHWVRVAQVWAGKKWGAMYIPRIGQEVIVEFEEGDPDRPIVTGRVYNADAMPPYGLPENKTRSTLKSNSSLGGQGFNEIRFEDKKGKEQVFIHAERNQDIRVKNDEFEYVGNDRHLIIKQDQFEKVERDKHSTVEGDHIALVEGDQSKTVNGSVMVKIAGSDHLTVAGDQLIKITGDQGVSITGNHNEKTSQSASLEVGMNLDTKAGMNSASEAGMTMSLKAGMMLNLEAGVSLSLKVGGSFVSLSPAFVAISGPIVMINSGGSAGSATAANVKAPAAPEEPAQVEDPKVADDAHSGDITTVTRPGSSKPSTKTDSNTVSDYDPAAEVLASAADSGAPFCEICQKNQG